MSANDWWQKSARDADDCDTVKQVRPAKILLPMPMYKVKIRFTHMSPQRRHAS